MSGTNGLIGFLQASNVAFYIYTNNPSNYVNQTQLTAATNGFATSSATNGLATTNFVLSTVANSSNTLVATGATISNALATSIHGATNGMGTAAYSNSAAFVQSNVFPNATNGFVKSSLLGSAAYSNSAAFINSNALPNLTNNFYPLTANPSNYLTSVASQTTATNISGGALLQVTNISFWAYTNNASNYVTALITNGFAGTNYVNTSTANASNALVSTGISISNGVMNNLTASNTFLLSAVSATNTAEIARVTAQIASSNALAQSNLTATNAANLVITTNLFGVSTNYANTNTMSKIAASNAVVLVTVSNNLVNATNGFVANTNGIATSLTLSSNAYFGSSVAQTIILNGTPYFGLTGAGNSQVNGTYGKETSSIWTNFNNPNYTIILSGGIYYAQSNSVSLYAFATAPATNGTIVSPGINPVPAFTLGWTFNLNGGVFIGQFNSTNETQKTLTLINQTALTNNSYQQITLYNTNNVYYGTFVGTNAVNATNATYLGGLYYTNYVTFGSIGGGYLTNNNEIIISGEVAGSGTTNIIVNPTATFTNDVNSLAQTIATAATNGVVINGQSQLVTLTNMLFTNNAALNVHFARKLVLGNPSGMLVTIVTNSVGVYNPSTSVGWDFDFSDLNLPYLEIFDANGVMNLHGDSLLFKSGSQWTSNNFDGLSFGWGLNQYFGSSAYITNGSFFGSGTISNSQLSQIAVNATNSQKSLIANVATNGATVSAGDGSVTVTPSVNANGTTNYVLTASGSGGSATNAIALLNGNGTNTTLVTGKSITVTNLSTTNITAMGINPITVIGANNGGTGTSAKLIVSTQASTSPGAHGSLYFYPGYSDGTGYVTGTNFLGISLGFGLSSFNLMAGQNTFVHQYLGLPLQVLNPDYGASYQTNIFQILTNGVPIVYVDQYDQLHAPIDATNLFNVSALTNGFVTASITNGFVSSASGVTNGVVIATTTISGTASVTTNTLALVLSLVTVPDNKLSANVPLLNGANIWTGSSTYYFAGLTNIPTGGAAGLTNRVLSSSGENDFIFNKDGSINFASGSFVVGAGGDITSVGNINSTGALTVSGGPSKITGGLQVNQATITNEFLISPDTNVVTVGLGWNPSTGAISTNIPAGGGSVPSGLVTNAGFGPITNYVTGLTNIWTAGAAGETNRQLSVTGEQDVYWSTNGSYTIGNGLNLNMALTNVTVTSTSTTTGAVSIVNGSAAISIGVTNFEDMISPLSKTEISITGSNILDSTDFGKWHVCSGTSNYNLTLPTTATNAGKFIGLRMNSTLNNLVTIKTFTNTESIDGQTNRIMWQNEVAVLKCDGTNWAKVAGKSRAMYATMDTTLSQLCTNQVWTKVLLNSNVVDAVGSMTDTVNNRINVRRPGLYLLLGSVGFSNTQTNFQTITGSFGKNNTTAPPQFEFGVMQVSAVGGYGIVTMTYMDTLAIAGDYYTVDVYQQCTPTITAALSIHYLTVVEQSPW